MSGCPGRDSNPHGPEGHVILSHVRLPVPPPGQVWLGEPRCPAFGFPKNIVWCGKMDSVRIFFLGGCASQEQGLASCDALKEIISPLLSKDGKLL